MTMLGIVWVPQDPVTSQGGKSFETFEIFTLLLDPSC